MLHPSQIRQVCFNTRRHAHSRYRAIHTASQKCRGKKTVVEMSTCLHTHTELLESQKSTQTETETVRCARRCTSTHTLIQTQWGCRGVSYKLQPHTGNNNLQVSVSLGGCGRAKWLHQLPLSPLPPSVLSTFLANSTREIMAGKEAFG